MAPREGQFTFANKVRDVHENLKISSDLQIKQLEGVRRGIHIGCSWSDLPLGSLLPLVLLPMYTLF